MLYSPEDTKEITTIKLRPVPFALTLRLRSGLKALSKGERNKSLSHSWFDKALLSLSKPVMSLSQHSELVMIWKDSEQISHTLETTFNEILAKRMCALPIVNAALSVQAVGFNRFGEDWLGVLITPWFMNLLLLPGPDSIWRSQQPGTKIDKHFPYGVFEFTLAGEARIGTYALCSLFSPMFQFENQAAALATGQAALQGLLTEVEPRGVSRRELLHGVIGKR